MDTSSGDDDKNDDDINDNIEDEKFTSEDDDEVEKYVNVSVNSNSDSIYKSLAGRVLHELYRRKITAESNFYISGWALSV